MTTRRNDRTADTEARSGGRTAIITLTMSSAFPHAAVSINSLNTQLGEATQHFVLLNDKYDEHVANAVAHPYRRVLCAGSNLGVAPGRNRLIDEAILWGADLVVVLDDDLISPSDYIDTVIAEYRALQKSVPKLGAVAPAILSHRFAEQVVPGLNYEQLRDTAAWAPATSTWIENLARKATPPTPGQVEHLGIRGWPEHYLGTGIRALQRYLERSGWHSPPPRTPPLVVANDKIARENLATGRTSPIPVDTLPGGVWCVGSEVLQEVGPLEEAFAPFGFEDAEWCIRAREMGFEHFCTPAALVAHDLQERLSGRPPPEVFRTRGRARSLLIRMHAPRSILGLAIASAALEPLDIAALPAEVQRPAVDSWITGIVEGATRPINLTGTPGEKQRSDLSIETTDGPLGALTFGVSYTVEPDAVLVEQLRVEWPDGASLSGDCNLTRKSESSSWQGTVNLAVSGSSTLRRMLAWLLANTAESDWAQVGGDTAGATGLLAHLAASQCEHSSQLRISLDGHNRPPQATVHHSCGDWST